MLSVLLNLALLVNPASGSVALCAPASERPWQPAAGQLPHAARSHAPRSPRRRFRDYLDDDDDPDGRGRTGTLIAVLPPSREPPSAARALLRCTGPAPRLAAVPLIYALCTLLI